MKRLLGLLLVACATPESLVRTRAANDFGCAEKDVTIERRSRRYDLEQSYESHVYVARGCGTAVVYAVGGEWFSSWAAPCAPVTVNGKALRTDAFAHAPRDLCIDTIADAGALGVE